MNYSLIAKVADFGLANRIYCKPNGDEQFGACKKIFPLRWSAYEILRDGIAILEKSDVWSFGILIWELFYLGAAMPYSKIAGKIHHLNLYSVTYKSYISFYTC